MKTLTTFIFLLIGVFIFCSNQSYAQGFSDVKRFEDRALKLFIRGTYVKPDADEIYGGITINGSMAINKLGKGGPRIRYENPTLGDAIFWLARLINKKPMTTVSGMATRRMTFPISFGSSASAPIPAEPILAWAIPVASPASPMAIPAPSP